MTPSQPPNRAWSASTRTERSGYLFDSRSILALIAEARGDLDGASAAYEALLERCRAAGQHGYELFSLLRLAALRVRQGDNVAADSLYDEAIACSFSPSVSADAKIGQAAVARHIGDLARARALLDEAGDYYQDVGLPAGQTAVLTGLAWWALVRRAGKQHGGMVYAADASRAASASGDSAIQLLADTAVAAVKAFVDPTHHNVEGLVALAQQTRPDSALPKSYQLHGRAGRRRAHGPRRSSDCFREASAEAGGGQIDTFLRDRKPPVLPLSQPLPRRGGDVTTAFSRPAVGVRWRHSGQDLPSKVSTVTSVLG